MDMPCVYRVNITMHRLDGIDKTLIAQRLLSLLSSEFVVDEIDVTEDI